MNLNKVKLRTCGILLAVGLTGSFVTVEASNNEMNTKVAQQVGGQFKDVNSGHYASDAINWAKSNGIIDGYPNGTFKPSEAITEAQFAKMISQFLGLQDDKGDLVKQTPADHWSNTHYDALASYSVPLNGYFDNALKNKPVKRGVVAQAISYMTGNAVTLSDSINFMLDEGITTGQNLQFANKDLNNFFGSQNNLTRAQVAAFLYRMHNASIDEAIGNALSAHENNDGLSLVGLANKGMNTLDKSLRLGKLGVEKPGNGGGNTKPPVENPSKTNSEYINELKSIVGETNIQVLENKGFDFKSTKQHASGSVSVAYRYSKQGYEYNVLFYMKDGKLISVNSDYAHDGIKEVYANLMGISKSKLTGGNSDTKIQHIKYYITYSDSSYSLYVK